mmetsp:Transcript_12635/g.27349  ORF Transcript_12635/g.27349 Transcript_12635/m.27349 type:complete len:269 (-) Transcript_12635:990-1796(-)
MLAILCSPFFLSCRAFARSAREDLEASEAVLPIRPTLTTIEAVGIKLCSRSDMPIASVSVDFTMRRFAVHVIWISSSLATPPGNLLTNSERVSSALISRLCTFFLPSIRSLIVQAFGSTCSSSSSSESYSSSSSSASAARRARSISSRFTLAALAISYRFLSIHLSIQSLATSRGATLTAFLPFPMMRASPSVPSGANPTLLRIEVADGRDATFAAMTLFFKLTRRNLTSYGSRTTLDSNDRTVLADSSASAILLLFTNSSSLATVRS